MSATKERMKRNINGTQQRLTGRLLALHTEAERALGNVRNGGSHSPTFAQMGAEVDRLIAEREAKLEMLGEFVMGEEA